VCPFVKQHNADVSLSRYLCQHSPFFSVIALFGYFYEFFFCIPIIVLISFYVQFYQSSEHAVRSIEHVTNKTLKNQ
jgi:hypothetical protein